MELTDLQREHGDFYTPRFSVTVEGEELREFDGVVSDLSVDTTTDGADTVSFALNYPFDRERGAFEALDWDRFAPGASVDVALGYDELEPAFAGRIASVRAEFPTEASPVVAVDGYGRLHDMTGGTNDRSWDDTTDAAVAADVAGSYGFRRTHVDETGIRRSKVFQEKQTDLAFLRELAERNGVECFARRGEFYFRAPDADREPVATLSYGRSLSSFSLERTDAGRVGAVEVRHWDPDAKEAIVGVAGSEVGVGGGAGAGATKRVVRAPVESEAEAERLAEATCARIEDGLVRGRGETVGLPAIQAGENLRVEGVGPGLSGTLYVERATHRIDDAGYRTSFELRDLLA